MTTTYTRSYSETFTRTSAKYLVSKIAADLRQMQRLHGEPSDARIDAYVEELITLLTEGYLGSVTYGFQRAGEWVVALHYQVNLDGSISAVDDRPGRVPLGDTWGATFGSFLTYSLKWLQLTDELRRHVERQLPFIRTHGDEPGGAWSYSDRTYSRDGVSLGRRTIGQ
ncbi:MAG: hypothetical protein F4W96_01430 [Chloroflexi bacterium]|nr:hypothetical protein [Chloroflexota bacterium]